MNATERYLFDVQGYLLVEDVLSQEELKHLNEAIDKRQEAGQPIQNFLMWEEPVFRALINHPKAKPYLSIMLGNHYRLDHEYAIIHRKGDKPLHLHGGNTPYDPGQYYHVQNGTLFSGLTVYSFALSEIGQNDGGFCCIPGSHKANFRVPEAFKHYEEIGPTVHIAQKPGDLLIFTEALTHGTFAWQGAHERRSLLYKYSPLMIAWAKYTRTPELLALMTPEQKEILDPTYHPYLRQSSIYDEA
ncbi:phytanoyl-CoA dioxygenase family protein [Paenibacillus spongiae]|uniref:Phytanoyl-CoA dioxygenase family protein n=1 Tax=Paenibacillus spongiae TaxID=2909671 RepID=A0ABY5SDG8_9BACL|nr:phytanoyl-CoA dioxygenase family protein [Paenibacillus spongiae]UVI32002.1 phytanoyl-CoA dioxygenase family protein [Paenibacillus spongiae]